jgi:hypothetical protein
MDVDKVKQYYQMFKDECDSMPEFIVAFLIYERGVAVDNPEEITAGMVIDIADELLYMDTIFNEDVNYLIDKVVNNEED